MNEGVRVIFQHEDSPRAGSHCCNMKTSIQQNTLFVVVIISLLLVYTQPVMLSPPPAPIRHSRIVVNPNNGSFPRPQFLTPDLRKVSMQTGRKNFAEIEERPQLEIRRIKKPPRNKRLENSFKREGLRLLGIQEGEKPRGRVKVPQYMMDLYKQQVTRVAWMSQGRRIRRGLRFDGNTVRSFAVDSIETLVGGRMNRISLTMYVNSALFHDESINGAELRIFYQPRTNLKPSNRSPTRNNFWRRRRLEVYYVKQCVPDCQRLLLDSKHLDDYTHPHWISFDVSQLVKSLELDSRLRVTFVVDDLIAEDAVPLWIQKLSSRDIPSYSPVDDDTHQPILVVYSDSLQRPTPTPIRRRRRSPSEGKSKRHSKWDSNHHKHLRKQCRIRNLYVDFAEFDWLEWIIAPQGFNASMCQGSCPRVLPDHLNATNHAVLQSLLHWKDPRIVPEPCCVPTELLPTPLLIVQLDTVALKNYPDMMVKSCGCR